MKKAIMLSFMMIACLCAYSQSPGNDPWPDSLNTAKDANYLSDVEKAVIFEMNKVRTNPKKYAEYIREQKVYYEGNMIKKPGKINIVTQEGLSAVDECIAALENSSPVKMLLPHEDIAKASKHHAKDLSLNELFGHQGSDGSWPQDRIERYNKKIGVGENVGSYYNNAFDIVYQLLVDDGVPSRGHRENIMRDSYTVCAVALETHPKSEYVCVINYGFILQPGQSIVR